MTNSARRTTSRRERRVTGRFASSSVRPIGRIQRFLLIQIKPKHVFRRGVVFRDTRLTLLTLSWLLVPYQTINTKRDH